jgi:hypothetical protein
MLWVRFSDRLICKSIDLREAGMGGLVLTKGTRHLIKHFQGEFSGGKLKNLREDKILGSGTKIVDAFDNSHVDLAVLTDLIRHGHSGRPDGDKRCLLPDDSSGGQPHLEARWMLFLNTILSAENHQKIREAIVKVLKNRSYDHIDFDCIESTAQDVFISDEFDKPETANPKKYLRIVLATAAMSKYTGDPDLELDPQGGYTFTLAPPPADGTYGTDSDSKPTQD